MEDKSWQKNIDYPPGVILVSMHIVDISPKYLTERLNQNGKKFWTVDIEILLDKADKFS